MIKKTLNLIKKNLLFLNILIILSASTFYYLNYNKFDTYAVYKSYDFESRRSLFLTINSLNNMKMDFIDTYLSDIHFSKDSYDKENIFFKGDKKKINTTVNLDEKKLEFIFKTKKVNLFNNFEDNSSEEFKTQISDFVIKSLNIYHKKLLNIFIEKNDALNDRLNEIKNIDDLSTRKILTNGVWNEKNNIEQYISLLREGNKLIMIKGYDSKFRRIFLNTNEFFISSLILLILFNLVVKNYNKVLK